MVKVFTPSWIIVYLHPSAVAGPENILKIRDFLLKCPGKMCNDGIDKAVKKCFLNHALTWFTPQSLGLSVLSDDNDMTKEFISHARKVLNQDQREKMLWDKRKPLISFMSPDVASAICLRHGSKAFW